MAPLGRNNFSRVEASHLVKGAYVLPVVSPSSARLAAAAIGLTVSLLLGAIIGSYVRWLLFAFSLLLGLWLIFSTGSIGDRLALAFDRIIFPWHRPPRSIAGPSQPPDPSTGATAETWACERKDYDKRRRHHKDTYGKLESALPFRPEYRFVIATCNEGPTAQAVAFSEGSHASWHPTSKLYKLDRAWFRDPYGAEHGRQITAIADALEEIICLLFERDRAMSRSDLGTMVSQDHESQIDLALKTAKAWRLIKLRGGYQSHVDGTSSYGQLIELTDTGRIWNMASPKFQKARTAERKRVGQRRRNPGSVNIGTINAANVNVAGKKISDQQSYGSQQTAPDQRLINCLIELLGIEEIPWDKSDLAGARWVLEEAVEQKNPHLTGMNRAMAKINGMCGEILTGMLSIGSYSLLMEHFK